MNREQYVRLANSEPLVQIKSKKDSREFLVRQYTYGVLVPDQNHPLSCVSVANSSLSIDLWIGCAWQCAYCQVQGSQQDLADNGAMPRQPQRRNQCTIDEIIDALIEHPFFIPNETVLSIGTASTEPFASGPVVQSTFDIMNGFVHRQLRNPFWIVSKAGVPKGRKLDLAKIVQATRGLMISLCWADNPNHVEPAKNNRFLNVEEAKEAGVILSWYMRPLTPEWSGTRDRVEMMMLWVKRYYGHLISAIVPGGLRWTEGIERGLTEVHNVQMPEMAKHDNEKDLPEDLANIILELAHEHFPDTPVYFKSSCAITHMLKVPSLSSVQLLSRHECEMSICPHAQRQICASGRINSMNANDIQAIADSLGIATKVVSWDSSGNLVTDPPLSEFTYALRQVMINNLGGGVK